MRVLLLGKNGQVGGALQRSLAQLGTVIALGREAADLENATQLRKAVTDAAPDIIVNAAAYTAVDKAEAEPERADRVNHRAVAELAALAAARGAWIVHYSTDYVFDGRKPAPYVETDGTMPINAYGRSKGAGEEALAASGATYLVFRTSWVHAPYGRNFVRTILRLASERDTIEVVTDQLGAPTPAALIAEVTAGAIRKIATGDALAPGIYHLTASGAASWFEVAQFAVREAIARGASLKVTPADIVPITSAQRPTAVARPANSRLDTGKLRAALGISLPHWTDGVRATVDALVGERVA